MSQNSRVLAEIRCPKAAPNSAPRAAQQLNFPSLAIDLTFSPVDISPDAASLAASLDASNERLVLLRGTFDLDHLDRLSAQQNVSNIFLDSQLMPFANSFGMAPRDDWLISVGASSPNECPIPPCDVQPAQPRGYLREVAAFVGADRLWDEGIKGDGIAIGIADGGLLAGKGKDKDQLRSLARVMDGWPKANWGTIAGWSGHANMLATDVLAMAPEATLYDIRIFDPCRGRACISDAIAGIHWAIEKFRATGTPHILCCGWGIYQQADDPKYATDVNHPLTRKIVEAMDEGIIVLFAAGNGGQSCPAIACGDDVGPGKSIWGANGHPRVMTVGAVNIDEQLIGYSSQGPAALDEYKPDFCGISHFQGYFPSDTGTSAACAVAAGVVALLKQARPTLTQEAVKRILKSTAKDIGPPGWDRHSGSGIIQAKAAYDQLIGRQPVRSIDVARLQKLELENRHLKEMYVELALERRLKSGFATSTP
jgi:serine protease AprX